MPSIALKTRKHIGPVRECVQVLRTVGGSVARPAAAPLGACMLEAGVSPREDVFLRSMLAATRTFALKQIQVRILFRNQTSMMTVYSRA